MNILKFLWYLLKSNADFSWRTTKRQIEELLLAILFLAIIVFSSIYTAFVFDILTGYRFYDILIDNKAVSIFSIFVLKFSQGFIMFFFIMLAIVIVIETNERLKIKWKEFKNERE